MKQFKLYAIYRQHELLLTNFNNQDISHSNSITFDEQLTENDFDQYTLTFSSMHFLPSTTSEPLYNYYIRTLQFGTQLRLETEDRVINFIISDIVPQLSKDNIQYNYTAQDELSYLWSRHNLGYSYPMTEEEENSGVHNIYEYANYILRDNHLDSIWWAPANNTDIAKERFTFSIDNSNPYNALIEACNVLGYSFHVDYDRHQLIFYKKDKNKFSGYRFRPEVNIKSFSASYSASDFCTMLHATGGTDEYSNLIPLVPHIPHCFQIYFSENEDWKNENFILNPTLYRNILIKMLSEDSITVFPELEIDNKKPLPIEITKVSGGTDEQKYFIYYPNHQNESTNELDELEFSLEEINEALTFTRIAEKVPTLGQFLYDFSFWELNNFAPDWVLSNIKRIFNKMQKQNVMLKIYTPKYYRLISSIAKINAKLEAYAEQYEAEYRAIEDKIKNTDKNIDNTILFNNFETLSNIVNNIWNELTPNYFELYHNLYGAPSNQYFGIAEGLQLDGNYESIQGEMLFDEWLVWAKSIDAATESYNKYVKKYDTATKKINKLEGSINLQYNDEYIVAQGEQAAALEYINSYKTLINSWKITNENETMYIVPGKYSLLLGLVLKRWKEYQQSDWKHEDSLEYKIKILEATNSELEHELYVRYGDYIYEKEYENADELDSVGLYNQAVSAMQLYNRPQASYNLTVIDLDVLEEIGLPDLSIGNHIYVYNEYLNLKETEATSTEKALNNIQYTDNDLVITGISRKLRSADDIQITVEKTNQTDSILGKLLATITH